MILPGFVWFRMVLCKHKDCNDSAEWWTNTLNAFQHQFYVSLLFSSLNAHIECFSASISCELAFQQLKCTLPSAEAESIKKKTAFASAFTGSAGMCFIADKQWVQCWKALKCAEKQLRSTLLKSKTRSWKARWNTSKPQPRYPFQTQVVLCQFRVWFRYLTEVVWDNMPWPGCIIERTNIRNRYGAELWAMEGNSCPTLVQQTGVELLSLWKIAIIRPDVWFTAMIMFAFFSSLMHVRKSWAAASWNRAHFSIIACLGDRCV